MKAIDVSFATLTAQKARRLRRQHGIELFVQDLWTGGAPLANAQRNLELAGNAGIELAAYIALAGAGSGARHVDNGKAQVTDEMWKKLHFVAVDVELDGIPNRAVQEAVDRVTEMGQRPVIYTSWNAWVNKQGNPTAFRSLPLWNASWDARPAIDFRRTYGGWARSNVIGKQHTGDTQLDGVTVDLNTFDRDKVMSFPEHLEEASGGDKVWIVTVPGTRRNYITNGIVRRFIPTAKVREELQKAGILPKEIIPITKETMAVLKEVK